MKPINLTKSIFLHILIFFAYSRKEAHNKQKTKENILFIILTAGAFLCAWIDGAAQTTQPATINEELKIKDRPALLFTADDFNLLKSRYILIPDEAKGKQRDIHEAWFSEDETLRKQQTQWWINYWKKYAQRWTNETLSTSQPDGVAMRGIWRTMHLFDIVVSWGYLTEAEISEYRSVVSNAIELALGSDVYNLGANINPRFRTHNIYTDVFLAAGLVGFSFPELSQSKHWIEFAERQMNYQMETSIFSGEAGSAWHECPRYHGYVLKLYTQYFITVRNRTGVDYFQQEEFKALAKWFVNFSTPQVKLAGNVILTPGIGDTTWDTEWHGPLNIIAQQYKKTDPQLSKALAWIWKEAGSPYDVEQTMDILIDPDVVSEKQNLSSAVSEGKGHVLMREGHNTEEEIWFMLKCGKPSLNGHENEDWNSFSLFAYGQPLALDAGSGDYNDEHSRIWNKRPWSQNMVVFRSADETDPMAYDTQRAGEEGHILMWHTDADVDYSITDAAAPSKSKKNLRHVIFIKPDYFIIKDEIEHDRESSWLLHTLTEKELEWGTREVTSHTLNNTAMDLHVVLPDRDLVPHEWEGRIGAWVPVEDEDDDFYGYKYQKYFEVRANKNEDYLMVLNPRKESMSKLAVVSKDGGKTIEIDTGTRQDVITFNESETIIRKGDKTITIEYTHLPPKPFKSTRPKINQTGYLPDAPKEFSILSESAAAGQQFTVENENSEVVFTGALEASLVDDREVSGEEVFRGEFSGLKTAGRYRVKLGEKSSAWFEVQEDLFDQALFNMLRFFFLVQGNSAVNDPVSGLAHGVSHAADEKLDDGAGGVVNLSGGWYTGSDYSKIVPHTAFACAHLMNLYDANSSFFNQFDLSLPDHDETIPDLPELVRSGVEWLLKMQRADGSVFHEVVSSSFQMGAHGPDEDPSERSVCFTDRFSTIDAANVCAVAAQASRFFASSDPAFSELCRDAALKSWSRVQSHPGIGIEGSGLVDPFSWQEEMWAKAEIYMLTGDQTILGSFYNDLRSKTVSAPGLSTPELFGCINLYHHPGTPSFIKTWIEQAVIEHAQRLKQVVDNSGYRCALDKYNWQEGNNSAIANSGNVFIYAFLISGNSEWLNHASFQVDYLMGRNSLDFSFVSGYGERRVRDPYHWIPGRYQFSPPGLLVNGAVDSRFIPGSPAANEVEETLKNAGFPVAKTYRDTIAFPLGNGITVANVSSLAYLTGFLSAHKRDVSNSFYDRPLAQTDGLVLNYRNNELTCANCQGVSQLFLYNLRGQLLYSNANVFFEKESNGVDLRNLIRKESVVLYKLVDENGAIGSGKVFFSKP